MGERPDLAGRVAWTYLATLAAAALGGLIALVSYQVVDPLVCGPATGELAERALTCSLVSGMGLWVAGFAAAFAGALALVKLDRRLAAWLAMVAGLVGLLAGVGGLGQWWWTAAVLLLPAAAGLASAAWSQARGFRLGQQAVLGALLLAGLVVLTWQLIGSANPVPPF